MANGTLNSRRMGEARGKPAPLTWALVSICAWLSPARADDYQQALAPREWHFPRDHGRHNGFKIEWWYFTGNLADVHGRRFGYQLTFFRSALAPQATTRPSAWAATDLYFAHAAVSDVQSSRFHYDDRLSRNHAGLAASSNTTMDVILKDWSVVRDDAGVLHLIAKSKDFSLDLTAPEGVIAYQGPGGLSQKGPNPGQASFYYSMPRLATKGTITLGGASFSVTGLSWFDHEFSSNLLADNQTGWDWVSLHLLDGRDLMLYRLRNKDGSDRRFGTLVEADGKTRYLQQEEISMTPSKMESAPSGTRYPQHWDIAVKRLPAFEIKAAFPGQELRTGNSTDVTYYEGVMDATANGNAFGSGYLEMTGYDKK